MELKKPERREFIRILIGKIVTGDKGFTKPTKTICLQNTSVEEVYDKILKMADK